MEKIKKVWSDPNSLHTLSTSLQWISISLIFIGGFLQIGKMYVDRQEKAVSLAIQAEKSNPINQPIRTGSVTIELIVDSDENLNTTFMDRGGYLFFVKDRNPIMTMSSTQATARQLGNSTVLWRGIFNLDTNDNSINKPIKFLNSAQLIQMTFLKLKNSSLIQSGKAVFTFNSNVRFEIIIPKQTMLEDKIIFNNMDNLKKILDKYN